MLYIVTVLSIIFAINNSLPAATCEDQIKCLDITRERDMESETEDGPDMYEVCLIFNDENEECLKEGTISHVCDGADGESKTEGWQAGSEYAQCQTVPCNDYAYFGVKDGKGCGDESPESSMSFSGVYGVYCYALDSEEGGYCHSGNGLACTWKIPAPSCGSCGDGILDDDEECDDNNNDDGDGCSSTCVIEFCGDGIVNNGEECDDGNTNDEDGCSSTCLIEEEEILYDCSQYIDDFTGCYDDPHCCIGADGCVDVSDGECETESESICGNGILEDGEECDDGNMVDGDGCSSFCETETTTTTDCSSDYEFDEEGCDRDDYCCPSAFGCVSIDECNECMDVDCSNRVSESCSDDGCCQYNTEPDSEDGVCQAAYNSVVRKSLNSDADLVTSNRKTNNNASNHATINEYIIPIGSVISIIILAIIGVILCILYRSKNKQNKINQTKKHVQLQQLAAADLTTNQVTATNDEDTIMITGTNNIINV